MAEAPPLHPPGTLGTASDAQARRAPLPTQEEAFQAHLMHLISLKEHLWQQERAAEFEAMKENGANRKLANPATEIQPASYTFACDLDGWPLEGEIRDRYDASMANVHDVRSLLWRGNSAADIYAGGLDVFCRWVASDDLKSQLRDGDDYKGVLSGVAITLLSGTAGCLGTAMVALALRSLRPSMHLDDEYVLMTDESGDHGFLEIRNPNFPTMTEDAWGENAVMLERHFQSAKYGSLMDVQPIWRKNQQESREIFRALPDEMLRLAHRYGEWYESRADDVHNIVLERRSMDPVRIWPLQPKYAASFVHWIPILMNGTKWSSEKVQRILTDPDAAPVEGAGGNVGISATEDRRDVASLAEGTDPSHQVRLHVRAVGEVTARRSGVHAPKLNVRDATSIAGRIVELSADLSATPQIPQTKVGPLADLNFEDPTWHLHRLDELSK